MVQINEAALLRGFAAALDAAETFDGATAPNPPVGCALLDQDGVILEVAAHERAGLPHAEALALERCRARGRLGDVAAMVVTLEPCNHHGRTPPCTQAIIAAGLREVWIGADDPNPRVAGSGIARLDEHGVATRRLSVTPGPEAARLAERSATLIRPFARWITTGRPWIVVKQVIDRSGSMIPPQGEKTFSSRSSLHYAHQLRKRSDALLTGSGTILADQPEFTVRHVEDHADKRRLLLIADRRGRVPARYLSAAEDRGFRASRSRSPEMAIELAGAAGALRLLVEAGPTLTGYMLRNSEWDEHVFIRVGEPPEPDQVLIKFRLQESAAPETLL